MCSKDKRHSRTCVHCHREWQAKHARARYCSTRCQYLASGSRVILACQACGIGFECKAMEMRAGRRFCSRACMLSVRRRPTKTCPECGKMFAPRHRKDTSKGKGIYCSKRCAGAARRAGKRDGRWKEAQELRACRAKVKPSERMYAAMQKAMQRQLDGIASLWRAMSEWRPCLHCGSTIDPSRRDSTAFCSISCAAAYEHTSTCRMCGKAFTKRGMQGPKTCNLCSKGLLRESKKKHKRLKGNHRRRCRLYGGHYNPSVTSVKVFERDNYVCHMCKQKTDATKSYLHRRYPTVDHHPVPLSKGGDHDWHNVRCACRQCNSIKSDAWDGQLSLGMRWQS